MANLVWLLPLLPLALATVVVGLRAPLVLVAVYAFVVPFGSSLSLPLPLPGPFRTISTLVGLAATVAIIAHLAVARQRAQVLLAPMPVWCLLVGFAAVTALWSVNVFETLSSLLVLVSLVGLYAVVSLLHVDRRGATLVERGILAGGALTGLYAVYQLATGTLVPKPGVVDETPRFHTAGGGGEAGDPNITAAALLLPLAVGLGMALRSERPAVRIAALLSSVLVLGAILLTGSRGGLLGAAGVMVTLLVVERRRGLALASAAFLVVTAILVVGFAPETLQDRLAQTGSTGRTDIWRVGLYACADHCVTGAGWGAFSAVHRDVMLSHAGAASNRLSYGAHNVWLRTGVEGGVVALLLLLAGVALTFRELQRVPSAWRGPPLAALIGLLVSNFFLANLGFKYFWLVFIYAGVMTLAYAPPRIVASRPARPDHVLRTPAGRGAGK